MASHPLTLTREQVREIDRRAVDEYGMTSLVLMENAGRGAAELLCEQGVSGRVCVCCGKGNNGGDGFVIARHLEAAGFDVHVLLMADPDSLRGDALTNWNILKAASTPLTVLDGEREPLADRWFHDFEWIVDGVLGTGIQGAVRDPYFGVIEQINRSGRSVLSVDLPSGLDCDTGRPLGICVRADLTATFVARKKGFDAESAAEWTGVVHVLPIGVPRQLLTAYNL